jgi:hypothetical protein
VPNMRSILCIGLLLMPLSCIAQSIDIIQLRFSGVPNPAFNATNSTSPNISTIESYLQNLPAISPPPFFAFGGYQLFSNGVSGFPEQVEVYQGVIRIFADDVIVYYQDVNGLESYLNSVFSMLFGTTTPPPGGQPSATPGIGGDPLPLSGAEPPFNPAPWNVPGFGNTQMRNNCYNYGVNKMTNTYAQPGRQAMQQFYCNPANMDCTNGMGAVGVLACNTVMASAIADGLIPWVANVACPADKFKVALVVDPGVDYHWYHQDNDGNWSHKLASREAINTQTYDPTSGAITDPRTANRNFAPGGPNYVNFCGFLCVRANPALVNITLLLPVDAREWLSYFY